LDQDLNAALAVRATMGSRLNELDALQATGDQLGLQFKQTLSKIQDTDYNKAITDLTQQQLILQVAQQSFAQVSKLSLFNYL
jgi:flagellar hook-associated protein 3 FlgL